MTCKEKVDEIEKILNDEHEVKIGRIRRIVEDAEDKAIPLDQIKKAREEIVTKSYNESRTYSERTDGSWCEDILIVDTKDVLEILDKLIESEE